MFIHPSHARDDSPLEHGISSIFFIEMGSAYGMYQWLRDEGFPVAWGRSFPRDADRGLKVYFPLDQHVDVLIAIRSDPGPLPFDRTIPGTRKMLFSANWPDNLRTAFDERRPPSTPTPPSESLSEPSCVTTEWRPRSTWKT